MIKLGISCGLVYTKRTKRILPYVEKELLNFITQKNVLPIMLPVQNKAILKQIISEVDGVVLSGGSDVAPCKYGVKNKKILCKWPGDPTRDKYEFLVTDIAHKLQKPIFGICRGLQVLNVYFGGTLYQDIPSQLKTKTIHSDDDLYDKIFHKAKIVEGSLLKQIYPKKTNIIVNTLHHQGIKKLAPGFNIDALSHGDNIIEAISMRNPQLIMAVQWHPEFSKTLDGKIIAPEPMWDYFLNECQTYRTNNLGLFKTKTMRKKGPATELNIPTGISAP